MLDHAVQRKEGEEGVCQWDNFGVGAGFQVDLEEWIIELKNEGEGKIQPAQFHLSRDQGPAELKSFILK